MTIQWGDTGRVRFGSLKTLNITPYVNEQNITSTALPIGAGAGNVPGSPQVSFTINTSTMIPTFSGANVLSYKSIYGLNVSGQNTSGSAQTVYFQINKNGSSYKTGNASITNNNYFTVSLCDGTLVNGDVLAFYIWTPASSGVNYFYQNSFCQPARVDTGAKNIINLTLNTVSFPTSTYFPLTGKVGIKAQASNYIFPNSSNNGSFTTTLTGSTTVSLMAINPTYKLYTTQAGDSSGTYCDLGQSATNYPQLDCNYQVTSVSYRDLFY